MNKCMTDTQTSDDFLFFFSQKTVFDVLNIYGPVKTIKVISSLSVYLTRLLLERLSLLCG